MSYSSAGSFTERQQGLLFQNQGYYAGNQETYQHTKNGSNTSVRLPHYSELLALRDNFINSAIKNHATKFGDYLPWMFQR
jgi:hypothetical protein